jgi:hypothetical protein
MLVVLGAVALVLLSAPVHRAAFVLTVSLALLLGLIAEVRAMVRRRSPDDPA